MSGGSPGSRGERRGQDPLQTLGANFPAGQRHAHMKHQFKLSGHNVLAAAFAIKERLGGLHGGAVRLKPSLLRFVMPQRAQYFTQLIPTPTGSCRYCTLHHLAAANISRKRKNRHLYCWLETED